MNLQYNGSLLVLVLFMKFKRCVLSMNTVQCDVQCLLKMYCCNMQ